MPGAIKLNLKRAAIVLAIALVLIAVMLRNDTNAKAVSASGSPISGLCVGTSQGTIKGDSTVKGREGTYAITSVSHSVKTPRDAASGQATGRRQHAPWTFTMAVSSATPKFLNALTTNETLSKCTFKFWKADSKTGKEKNYYKVELENVLVSSYSFSGRPGGADTVTFELTYQKIEWTWTDGGITAVDDWESPVD